LAGYLDRKLGGYQIKAVAEHFKRNPAVMSQGIRKLEQRLMKGEAVQRTITTLEKILARKSRKILF